MHPAVVTAVLLLVGTTITVADQKENEGLEDLCKGMNPILCDGSEWVAYDWNSPCMKYFETAKTFQEAEAHCRSLHSDLMAIHSEQDMLHVKCLSYLHVAGFKRQHFWIGAKRSGGGFIYTDGSKVDYTKWLPNQPDNYLGQEGCVESNALQWGMWNDASCREKRDFVCMMKT
ncbi:C-type isolectin Sp-CL4-like [Anarhichas minor]|uniref:C-type isolectin Sp-CL4-like n=1 Tax=Anarhichas minor TaxID=65739 RepID=UPI003F738D46